MNISVRELLLSVLSIFQSLGCKISMLYFMFSIWNKLIFEKLLWRTLKPSHLYRIFYLFIYLFFHRKAYGAMMNCHYFSSELCVCSGSDYVSPPAVCMTCRRNSIFFKQSLLFTQWPPAKQSRTVSLYAESSITLDMLADQTDDMLGS